MKVMRLLSSLKHDESERGIFQLGRALVKEGHESIIIASAHPDNELVRRLERDGNIYHQLHMKKKSWLSLFKVMALRRLVIKYDPDIIHIHSRTPAWVLHWALKGLMFRTPPKLVSTMYGFYPTNAYGRALLFSDCIITVSDSVRDYLIQELDKMGMPIRSITRIYRGVDTRTFAYRHNPSVYWLRRTFAEFPELEHKKWLLFPTIVGPEYGQEWLIDILGNLQDEYPNLHVIIMDDDEREGLVFEEFCQRLYALDLSHKVTFVGAHRNDMREWLAAANIVLALANQPESIGINALQAIHLGTPVVGWDRAAYNEILRPLFSQGLVKKHDAIALCRVVHNLLKNPIPPSITDKFTMREMIEQTLAIYDNLYEIRQQEKEGYVVLHPPSKLADHNTISYEKKVSATHKNQR